MTEDSPLGRIAIIGGGTAGWMAAAYLNRTFKGRRCSITVVETPATGTIGVGEATMPSLLRFVHWLGLDEADFMRRCSATYRLATRFTDWLHDDHQFWQPCGDQQHVPFRTWLEHAGNAGPYERFSLHALLAEAQKGPRSIDAASPIAGSYGYHVDPTALATLLREIATAEGVVHVFGTVREVERNERGSITAVGIGGERRVCADLYLDCTGHGALLMGRALGDPWIGWSGLLLCDRAIEMPLPRGQELPPFTQCAALAAGWMWRISLAHRTGCGYAFSSAHVEAEDAVKALLARAGLRRARSADPRLITWPIGRRTSCWTENCVAIGASAGTVEPLDWAGLHLSQSGLELLVEHLRVAGPVAARRTSYNRAMAGRLEAVRDFAVLRYRLSRRVEPFWRDARSVTLPETVARLLDDYDATGDIQAGATGVFSASSHHFALAAAGRLPKTLPPVSHGDSEEVLDRNRHRNMICVSAMPQHSDLIAAINRPSAGDGLEGLGVPNASWR